MFKIMRLFFMAVLAVTAVACTEKQAPWREMPVRGNAVYYWRTSLQLDSTERGFMADHHVSRIYCRYFDVVLGGADVPMPNATITFGDSLQLPDSTELVPTVFITENCLRGNEVDSLPRRIVSRILQMNATNGLGDVREIQIDCDWTERSRETFYALLSDMRQICQQHDIRLSATIRLHQLQMPAPPVDYGVLMLYNTGAPERFEERNPILDLRDVKPYVKYLADYELPLAAAYPVFQWRRVVHGVTIDHEADLQTILDVKKAVEARRPDLAQLILTYHLSTQNINRYTADDYETIYHD